MDKPIDKLADSSALCATAAGDTPTPIHATQLLFDGGDRAYIIHEGQRYTLRRTRLGKLILTK